MTRRTRTGTSTRPRTGTGPQAVAAAVTVVAALATAAGCGEPAPDAGPAAPQTGASTAAPTASAPTASASSAVRVGVTVTGGKAHTAQRRVKVQRGATVEITVTSDTADEFHLHGYDRELRLVPGRPAVLRFTADTPGVFEAELHHSGDRAFELQVG